jgi:CRISPR-associated endonuclease/helicase Cas3
MNELYSHPDYPLQQHINGVRSLSSLFLNEKKLPLTEQKWFQTLNEYIALFHDIGKAHRYFQDYIRQFEAPQKLRSHALLSAFLLTQFIAQGEEIEPIWRWFAFLIVKRHHGNLDDWLEEFKQFSDEMEQQLLKQIEAIDFEQLNQVYQPLIPTLSEKPFTKSQFQQWIHDMFTQGRKIRRSIMQWNDRNESLAPYVQLLFMFSLLLDADKSEAGIMQKETWSFSDRLHLPTQMIQVYKEKQQWGSNSMNELREQAFREVVNHEIDLSNHFYSLQLPTGMGKTLASFQFALNLRKEIEKKKGVCSRIIYSLPFLSIIDQTSVVLTNVFRANGLSVDHRLFLAHHHLAEMSYSVEREEEQNNVEYDVAKLLIEGWNSEIVLTTFVQLFHTIFSNQNKALRKFHRLANSIIIIDEIQAIPHRYWLVVKEMFEVLAKELNCYFLFSSATTPAIFDQNKVIQLVNPNDYFQALSRVELFPHVEENLTIKSFVDRLELDTEKSYLFIVNTIDCAKMLYEQLTEVVNKEEMTFLSTHIPPKERLRRIDEIKKGTYRLVVSTQLVEAGVDIDFDVVYRDLAPLDSVHQAAGRCNRHGQRRGEVHVISLTDGKRRYASYIYDLVRIDLTQSMLKNYEIVEEKEFFHLIEQYFQHLTSKMSNRESKQLLNGIKTLYFDGEATSERVPVSQFRLIESGEAKFDVFIELNEEAAELFRCFEDIIRIKNPLERQKAFASIKASFYQYIISIPRKVDHKPPIVHGIGYVNIDSLSDFYDETLGYKTKSQGLIW